VGGFGSGNWYRFDTKDAVEDHCALDVRKLKREGMLDPGYRGSLVWWQGGREVSSIGLLAEHGRVVLKYRHRRGGLGDEWEDVEQPVYLTWTPCNLGGERPWFVCPGVVSGRYCGRRVAILYSAGLYFLCRHCYDLTYRSRQASERLGALHKARRIRQRLGGSANLMEPFPARPKGMHRKTYHRLRRECTAAEMEYFRTSGEYLEKLTRGLFDD
jgi:hypothetical protein